MSTYFSIRVALVSLVLSSGSAVASPRAAPVTRAPVGGCAPVLSQLPNGVNGTLADGSCETCAAGEMSVADRFVLATEQDVCELTVWGGYSPTNTPTTDSFSVIVHADAAGLPGTPLVTLTGLSATRSATGGTFAGLSEYEYTLPVSFSLAAGTYWLEVFNDTGFATNDWIWEHGSSGDGSLLFALEAPGVTWSSHARNASFVLRSTTPVPVPALPSWSLGALLALGVAAGALLVGRRGA